MNYVHNEYLAMGRIHVSEFDNVLASIARLEQILVHFLKVGNGNVRNMDIFYKKGADITYVYHTFTSSYS